VRKVPEPSRPHGSSPTVWREIGARFSAMEGDLAVFTMHAEFVSSARSLRTSPRRCALSCATSRARASARRSGVPRQREHLLVPAPHGHHVSRLVRLGGAALPPGSRRCAALSRTARDQVVRLVARFAAEDDCTDLREAPRSPRAIDDSGRVGQCEVMVERGAGSLSLGHHSRLPRYPAHARAHPLNKMIGGPPRARLGACHADRPTSICAASCHPGRASRSSWGTAPPRSGFGSRK